MVISMRDVLKVTECLEHSGGLNYFFVGEERCDFPALLTPGWVDGGYCHKDNVDAERLRGGHLEFDPGCTACTSMTMRGRQHRRQDERETAGGTGRSLCGSHWKIANAHNGSEYLLVALRRERHVSVLSKHWRTNAARRSKMRWSTCSCCVVFGGSTVTKDENLWAQLTTGRENTLSFTPQRSKLEQSCRRRCRCSESWFSMVSFAPSDVPVPVA